MKNISAKVSATCIILLSSILLLHGQKIITGFEAPESVIKSGDRLFVSNIGGTTPNPMALDSNGFISELSVGGTMIERKFSKSLLNGPKGLAISGHVLYVADINRIVGFDMNSGKQIFELGIPGAMMLNDLCAIDDQSLAVSETIQGGIFIIDIPGKKYVFAGRIDGANGVTYDAKTKQLFACGMGVQMDGKGKLFVKDIGSKDTVFTELPNSPSGIFDGLELKDDDHLLVTDWVSTDPANKSGRFVVYGLKDHSVKKYTASTSPADLYYDKKTETIYLPEMMKNSVEIIKMGALVGE
jgi:hypothetical protein